MNQEAIKEIANQLGMRADYPGCLAVDEITHLVVPQVAMINDMLEMVQQ